MRSTGVALVLACLPAFVTAQDAPRRGPPPFVATATPAQPLGRLLYPNGAPKLPGGAKEENWGTFDTHFRVVRNVTEPTVTPYLPHPSEATGAAVIVAPGGAFQMLAIDAEGEMVARWLAARGVAAFVLKYRVEPTPPDAAGFFAAMGRRMAEAGARSAASGPPPVFQPAIDDGIASVRWVRAHATEFGVDPKRVGMVGFSAGAMNALGTAIANQPGARPDFIGLIYGPMSQAEIPADAPPLFAALAADDPLFGRGAFGLIDSWRKAGRPVEFHLYQAGDHGFGMRNVGTTATLWPEQFLAWVKANGFLQSTLK